ncbi:fimbria/pilus periplasmic chaperone [Hafnia alvei]|uniref:Gram-negative pili assembly chaperone domain protein n=1 Tax=Hafnia alvei ATCC 51873 TaxID=1002364 RepID=G9YB60_HAFAL|nr:fimbria/pilus periplasmic chaperone [Hafnia alvei]AJR00387.1 Fimbrial periplasmic chaperone SfmC [Enterobacteriaceae bacterium bta3-1]EHM39500.1 gram-negative pili assembly chaperone domain protein [Hafnia alvei ATCC 51873]
MNFFKKMFCKNNVKILLSGALILSSMPAAFAGGIALGSTRVIYPASAKQVSLAITNSDSKNVFLIQSWVATADGSKSTDFIITPPLFVMKPGNENTLRIMYVGNKPLPADRETVYYLNSKAIPSSAPSAPGQNTLQIATQSVIKLFVRPAGLPTKSDEALKTVRCQFSGTDLSVSNPSPYYVTLVNFDIAGQHQPNTMIAPMSSSKVAVPANHGSNVVSFQTVNDYGANTPKQQCVMQ